MGKVLMAVPFVIGFISVVVVVVHPAEIFLRSSVIGMGLMIAVEIGERVSSGGPET